MRAKDSNGRSLADALSRAAPRRPLALDGATGTGLMALAPDVDPARGLERLCAEAPDVVSALHEEHLRAGCDLVRTNTFCGSAPELEAVGLGGRARDLARRAAELARGAIARAGALDRYVVGVVGPGRGNAEEVDPRTLQEAERGRMEGLAEGGADALLVETVTSLRRARAAAAAAREVAPDLPLLVSATVSAEGRLLDGSSLQDLDGLGRATGAALLALNCAAGPESMTRPLAALRSAWSGPLGAWPNAGIPTVVDGVLRWPARPEELAAWCGAAAARHDLRIVGGCCGTTSEHVRAITDALV
ncbi:MAG: homocysteine S-methyltransferase family protein [Planctomycetota bacterium]